MPQSLVRARRSFEPGRCRPYPGDRRRYRAERQPAAGPSGCGLRHGTPHAWRELTGGIAAEINGDLNFANLETVVTDRNDLSAPDKAFNFRSHPAGVRHLVEVGFNLLSTANNHSIDFGERGMRETLRHLDALEAVGLRAHAGVGIDREAAVRPRDIASKGARLLFSAIGIGAGSYRATEHRPGQLLYAAPEDFTAMVQRLAGTEGDYRMLSVHYGEERQVMPGAADLRKLRDEAVRAAGIDLVIGHHAHVAAGVQEIEGRLIFYGLGNFLHLGMQDMAGFGICRDYGLLARLHLARGGDGRYRARAIEAVALTGMHVRTERMPASAGHDPRARAQSSGEPARRCGRQGTRRALHAAARRHRPLLCAGLGR